jgi:hypothetical protein
VSPLLCSDLAQTGFTPLGGIATGRAAGRTPDDDDGEQEWVYLAIDVRPARFGDVLGELNRTGWMITGSQELDGNRRPMGDGPRLPDEGIWQRVFAKRRGRLFGDL